VVVSLPRKTAVFLLLVVSTAVVIIDQISKYLVGTLFVSHQTYVVAPFLNIVPTYNKGISFSLIMLSDNLQRWPLVALAIGICILLLKWLLTSPTRSLLFGVALTLTLGGAVANLIDRIRLGHVIDFIQLHCAGWYFAIFNPADAAITVGVALLLLDSYLSSKYSRSVKDSID
jgi:signal peptidase II